MKRFIKSFLSVVIAIGLLIPSAPIVHADPITNLWKKVSNAIFPLTSTWDLASVGTPIANGYFTNINVSGTCTGCSTVTSLQDAYDGGQTITIPLAGNSIAVTSNIDNPALTIANASTGAHLALTGTTADPVTLVNGYIWYNENDARLKVYDGFSTQNFAYTSDIPAAQVTFPDNTFRVYDDGDTSKNFAVNVGNVSSATTRTFTVPDGDGIFPTTTGGSVNLSTGKATYAYTTGFSNTVYGITGELLTSGNRNTLMGSSAGGTLTTQSDVTAIGNGSLAAYTGNSSTAVGSNAGLFTTSGLNLVLIGAGADTVAGTENYSIAIGQNAKVHASNTAVIGSHSAAINDFYIGSGDENDNTTPATNVTIHGTNAYNQTDVVGSGLIFATGKGTGSATPGTIQFQTTDALGSGTTQQTLTTRLTINGSGILSASKISVGAQDSMTVNGSPVTSQFAADSDTLSVFESHTHSSTAGNGGVFYTARSRGTSASPTVVQNGDSLGRYGVVGYDGTDYAMGGILEFTVDGTPGANDMPTKFEVKLSPDGSQTPTSVFSISSAGLTTASMDSASTAVTQTAGDNSTKLATTAYVDAAAKPSPFDATVGSSGANYTTVGAAVTAGKSNLLLITSVTETANIAVPSGGLSINIPKGFTLALSTYQFTFAGAYNFTMYGGGTFTWNPSGSQIPINADSSSTVKIYDLFATNLSTQTNSHMIAPNAKQIINNLVITVGNASSTGIYSNNALSIINNVNIIGSGSSTDKAFQISNGGTATNLTFSGSYSAATTTSILNATSNAIVSNVFVNLSEGSGSINTTAIFSNLNSASNVTLTVGTNSNVNNIYLSNASSSISILNTSNFTLSNFTVPTLTDGTAGGSSTISNGAITNAYTFKGDKNYFSNVRFLGGATNNSGADFNTVIGCQFGAAAGGGALTLTINAGSNNFKAVGNNSDVVISDSGTASVLIANDIY